jgi:glucose-1-phosphate cytidylyltransferase
MENFRSAVVLCGGKGTRLGALGKKIPKAMVKIQGKEIIWYIIKILKKNKFNQIILPLGYKGNMIRKFSKKYKSLFRAVDLVNTGEDSDIGKRISLVGDRIKSNNFLLLNGDAIFNFNIDKIFKKHQQKKKDITFISGETIYPYGTIGTRNGKVIDFNRNLNYEALKVRNKNSYTAFNYTGMSVIKTETLKKFRNKFKKTSNFETELFPFFINSFNTELVKLTGFWHSVDNMKDINVINAKKILKNKYNDLKKIKQKLLK